MGSPSKELKPDLTRPTVKQEPNPGSSLDPAEGQDQDLVFSIIKQEPGVEQSPQHGADEPQTLQKTTQCNKRDKDMVGLFSVIKPEPDLEQSPQRDEDEPQRKRTRQETTQSNKQDKDIIFSIIEEEPDVEPSSQSDGEPPKKRARQEISQRNKQELCRYKLVHPRATQGEIRKHFSGIWGFTIGRSSISDILKNSKKWLSLADTPTIDRSRSRACQEPELESALFDWYRELRMQNVPVTGDMLVERGKDIGEEMGVENFSYSHGWLDRFKKRHGISRNSGDSLDMSLSDKLNSHYLFAGYNPNNVFRIHETCLFYKLKPDFEEAAHLIDNVKGGKRCDEMVSVAFFTNTTGTEKLPPLVVGHCERPQCFGKDFDPTVYVNYQHSQNSSMTVQIFAEWLLSIDSEMQQQKRRVLLLFNDAPGHGIPEDLMYIRVNFLAPEIAAFLKPVDSRLVHNFKLNYRHYLSKCFVDLAEESKPLTITLRESLRLVKEAWKDVQAEAIDKCWEFVRRAPGTLWIDLAGASSDSDNEIISDIEKDLDIVHAKSNLFDLFQERRMKALEWLSVDNDIETVVADMREIETVPKEKPKCKTAEADSESAMAPPTVTGSQVKSAMDTLILYLEQNPGMPNVCEHLDTVWKLRQDISAFSRQPMNGN